MEDLERESDTNKRQVQDLQEKLALKKDSPAVKKFVVKKSGDKDPLSDKKMQVMEDEINELRKKIIEKDRDFERAQAEQTLTKGKLKTSAFKTKDSPLTEGQSTDMKRQLQVVEQEASVLRTKTQTLEQENDKLLAEVKKLQLQVARSSIKPVAATNSKETDKMKSTIDELEKECNGLKSKLKMILEDPTDKLPPRTPKVFSDMKTKLQLKVCSNLTSPDVQMISFLTFACRK